MNPAAAAGQDEGVLARDATRQAWLFRSVVDALPGFAGIWDLSGACLHLNPAAARELGVPNVSTALRLSMRDHLLDPRGAPLHGGDALRALAGEGREVVIAHLRHAVSGELVPVHLSLLRIDDPRTREPFAVAALAVPEARSSSPASKAATFEATAPNPVEAAAAKPLHILLADDDLVNRRLASLMIERLGHPRPSLAMDGREAVAAAEAGTFDLVLMDVEMPELDGCEAARQITRRLADRCPYLLAMSANTASPDRERYMAAGFHDFTPKPLTRNGLMAALDRVPRRLTTGDDFNASAWAALVQAYRSEGAAQLVMSLVEDLPDQQQRHAEAQRSRDSVRLRRLAHGLRGTCLQLGATELAGACARVEVAAAEEPALASSLCETVMARYGALVERWRKQLEIA
ncbi:MAG: response regulator [Panacagrimonas sp.]